MARQAIGEFEVVDHGIENSQYFQGCGTTFTRFDNVVTGIGEDFSAAVDDCLEQVAQMDFDTEGMEARISADIGGYPTEDGDIASVSSYLARYREDDDCEDDDCELYYHVSLRWNAAE